jgi:zinc transport system ATP-binding protein
MTVLKVENLSISFGDVAVISKLSFELEEGDFLCVVGENGSGKSTLLKAITGEIQAKGKIKFEGIKQNQVGYISQKSKIEEKFPATVEEIVASGSLNSPNFGFFYNRKIKAKTRDALKALKIEKLAKRSFGELSGGQKQKVLLARALMATEKFIILDEPSNNLDQKSRQELYDNLRALNEQGMTVIMVTHDLDHGNLIGNKILSLSKNMPFFGSTSDYVERIHHD